MTDELTDTLKDIRYQIESKNQSAITEIENEITLWVHGEFEDEDISSIRIDDTGTGIDLIYLGTSEGESGLTQVEAVDKVRELLK